MRYEEEEWFRECSEIFFTIYYSNIVKMKIEGRSFIVSGG